MVQPLEFANRRDSSAIEVKKIKEDSDSYQRWRVFTTIWFGHASGLCRWRILVEQA
jgi:hypothetical protein